MTIELIHTMIQSSSIIMTRISSVHMLVILVFCIGMMAVNADLPDTGIVNMVVFSDAQCSVLDGTVEWPKMIGGFCLSFFDRKLNK